MTSLTTAQKRSLILAIAEDTNAFNSVEAINEIRDILGLTASKPTASTSGSVKTSEAVTYGTAINFVPFITPKVHGRPLTRDMKDYLVSVIETNLPQTYSRTDLVQLLASVFNCDMPGGNYYLGEWLKNEEPELNSLVTKEKADSTGLRSDAEAQELIRRRYSLGDWIVNLASEFGGLATGTIESVLTGKDGYNLRPATTARTALAPNQLMPGRYVTNVGNFTTADQNTLASIIHRAEAGTLTRSQLLNILAEKRNKEFRSGSSFLTKFLQANPDLGALMAPRHYGKKRRGLRGNASQQDSIRARRREGSSLLELSEEFGVAQSTIEKVLCKTNGYNLTNR